MCLLMAATDNGQTSHLAPHACWFSDLCRHVVILMHAGWKSHVVLSAHTLYRSTSSVIIDQAGAGFKHNHHRVYHTKEENPDLQNTHTHVQLMVGSTSVVFGQQAQPYLPDLTPRSFLCILVPLSRSLSSSRCRPGSTKQSRSWRMWWRECRRWVGARFCGCRHIWYHSSDQGHFHRQPSWTRATRGHCRA